MDEKLKSTQLKKCASLNSLVAQNGNQMSAAPTLNSPLEKEHLSLSLLTPRTRRFSCSSNGNGASSTSNSGLISPGPRLARITQLRQEECAEQVREANHEREVHSALSMSQSYEDLTLVMNENWSFKNTEEFSNPLHVTLPASNSTKCSSPSPTSSRHNVMRLQYGMSPSPTRRSFATRRSMSPIAIRPSPLGSVVVGSVKRKFDMIDDGNSCSSSSSSHQQPYKKFFTESYSRGSSPIMSPLPICPSPDSSTANSETFSGRITPKMFITTKAFSSMTSSPLSTHSFENDSPSPSSSSTNIASSSSSSSSSSSGLLQSSKDQQERMEVASCTSADSGVDASSDGVGSSSELSASSSEVVHCNDIIRKGVEIDSNCGNKAEQDQQDMIIEDDFVTPSNIPMMTL